MTSSFLPGSAVWEQSSDFLTIGGVTFLDEEHPDNLNFELGMQLAIHPLIGGSRTIQNLGPNPSDVTWSGQFFATATQQNAGYENVKARLAALKAMEVAGNPVPLTYLDQAYTVVVRKFKSQYMHRYWAKYDITVSVLSDQSGQYNTSAAPTTNAQVNNLTTKAKSAISQLVAIDATGTQAVVTAFNILFAAIEAAGVLSSLSGTALQSLVTTANAATSAATTYLNGVSSTSFSQFLLASQLVNTSQLMGRNIQQGQTKNTVVRQGGDLFALAATQYKDISKAFDLAAENGLISPLLSKSIVYQVGLPALDS